MQKLYHISRWCPTYRYRCRLVPEAMARWLFDRGSLTDRLIKTCGKKFRVRLIGQQHSHVDYSERQALGLSLRDGCLVRQVLLECNQVPVVFARTIMPLSSLKGPERRLAHLGEKSLGAILFANPHLHRGEVEITRIDPEQKLYKMVLACLPNAINFEPKIIWGRRSVFYHHKKSILVSELFLPEIVSYNNENSLCKINPNSPA